MIATLAAAAALAARGGPPPHPFTPQPVDPQAVFGEILKELHPRAVETWMWDTLPVKGLSASTIARTSPIPGVCERDELSVDVVSGDPLPPASPRVRAFSAKRTYLLISIEPRTELRQGETFNSWDARCAKLGQAPGTNDALPDRQFESWPSAESVWIAGQLAAELAKEAREGGGRLLTACGRGARCPPRREMASLFRVESVRYGDALGTCEEPKVCLRVHFHGAGTYDWGADVAGELENSAEVRFTSVRFRYEPWPLLED